MNRASLKHNVPLVHGALGRHIGQVTTFVPGQSPCYRCLHPKEPPAREVKNKGVLGPLCGVIGTLQVAEVLKVLLHLGEPLLGRLLQYDMMAARFTEIRFGRTPQCKDCAESM